MNNSALERARDECNYDENGRVTDAGKFEGETLMSVYWYMCMMDGDYGDEENEWYGTRHSLYYPDAEERQQFDLDTEDCIHMWVSDQGFVNVEIVTQTEWDELVEEMRDERGEEEEEEEEED